ncbi:MAG: zinc-binding dehydrogenase [Boseongicola sp. SB0676_bin_33]|nr:zinc-binding dehydrogenase [Boseongicola sp. SB0676_bin_33]MYK31812.1 zinc-binding dehydrogenase [Boseongicola sp. SB0670_bin_30]
MNAIVVVTGPEGPTLELATVPVPTPGPTQVLIRVSASGLNRADLRRTQAHFKVSGPVVAGLEVAGEIIECGAEVAGLQVGDNVAAMAPGGYAEFAVAEDVSAIKVPADMPPEQAAALATWYMTAHDAMVTAGKFRRGDAVLVTAAASGIGIATAQIARAMGAGVLIGSVRSPKDNAAFAGLGWDAVSAGAPEDIRTCVATATNERGVDVVIDTVGSGILDALMDATALGGRIVSVGRMGGFHDQIDLDKLALRRISLVGVTFRTRDRAQKAAVRDAMMRDLWRLLESGAIVPPVDRIFALKEALAAQEHMKANKHFGKVVLQVRDA